MESEKRIEELRRLGQASGGDPNEIIESSYWSGFQETWSSGLSEGHSAGRSKALSKLNIFIPKH
jgi:hypothetical protein